MTKHSYVAKFKRKDGFVFTKRFLASDLFEADEHALEYATKRDILYLDLGPAVQQKVKLRILYVAFLKGIYGMRFNSKSDRDLAFEQALLRYNIIKKELLKISKGQLSSAQETTLEELDEMSELVEQLANGEAVADLVAYAFLDDMELNWEFFQASDT